jgi:hypothetical protein
MINYLETLVVNADLLDYTVDVYAGQRKIHKKEKVLVSSCNGLPNAG